MVEKAFLASSMIQDVRITRGQESALSILTTSSFCVCSQKPKSCHSSEKNTLLTLKRERNALPTLSIICPLIDPHVLLAVYNFSGTVLDPGHINVNKTDTFIN